MKLFLSLLKTDMYRALWSPKFITSVVSILFIMIISCSGFMRDGIDVIYLLGNALSGSGALLFILCIAPILPYGLSLASDFEDKATTFWVIRTGTGKYVTCKFISSLIAGFLVVGISIVAFSFFLSMKFPVYNGSTIGDNPYVVLLINNNPINYIFIFAIHYSLSAALFAGAAITVSAFIPNKFSVMVVPLVLYFVMIRLTDFASIPKFLKVGFLVQGFYNNVSPFEAFLYKLIPVIIMLSILLFITIKQIKKRVGS